MIIELPDLEEIVCKAVPFEPKDCVLVRGMKLNRRERLKVTIREYAELVHLKKLEDHASSSVLSSPILDASVKNIKDGYSSNEHPE